LTPKREEEEEKEEEKEEGKRESLFLARARLSSYLF
jgi:hypothetical protein